MTRFRVVFPRFQINRRDVGTRSRLKRHGGAAVGGTRTRETEDMWHLWEMKWLEVRDLVEACDEVAFDMGWNGHVKWFTSRLPSFEGEM